MAIAIPPKIDAPSRLRYGVSQCVVSCCSMRASCLMNLVCAVLWSVGSVESRMTIPEGGTTGFSDDIRSYELAVTDHSAADTDRITVVPATLLADNVGRSEAIEHADLPFKIRVHQWLPNSRLREPKAGESNPATAGIGTQHIAEEADAMTGVAAGLELAQLVVRRGLAVHPVHRGQPGGRHAPQRVGAALAALLVRRLRHHARDELEGRPTRAGHRSGDRPCTPPRRCPRADGGRRCRRRRAQPA